MNRWQQQVQEFHRTFDHPIGNSPALSRPQLRCDLIMEEAGETVRAIRDLDLVGAVDGICDLLYVTIGAAVEFGVDIEPIFNEVHRSNMAKLGGPKRADGKTLKPDGWRPPDIAGEIERQRSGRAMSLIAAKRALQKRIEQIDIEIETLRSP